MNLRRINIISFRCWIIHLFLCLLIIFDLRTYLVNGNGISIATSGLMLLYLVCYLYLCVCYSSFHIRFFDVIVLLFLCIYGIRVYINIYIDGIYNTIFENNITYIVYFFLLSVLPYQACRRIPFSKINIEIFLIILFVFYFLALMYSFSNVVASIAMKTYVGNEGRFEANTMLDTIGYGHLGVTLTLISYSLLISHTNRKCFVSMLGWMGILCGVLSIILANSRSPMLALLVCVVIILRNRMNIRLLLATFTIVVLFVVYIDEINVFFQEVFKSQFVDRFLTIFKGDGNGMSGRNVYYNQGWKIFSENPLFGQSFLLVSGDIKGDYVHNSFLESLITGGIIEGVLYLVMTLWGVTCSYKLINNRSQYAFFAFFFIQMLIYSLFSRSLITLPLYWVSLSSVFSIYQLEYGKS